MGLKGSLGSLFGHGLIPDPDSLTYFGFLKFDGSLFHHGFLFNIDPLRSFGFLHNGGAPRS